MAAFRLSITSAWLLGCAALCWTLAADAAELTAQGGYSHDSLKPYQARYAIYRNGKLTGKMELNLLQRGERWMIRSSGSGTHGLARILAVRDNEEVSGRLQDGRFRPEWYTRHTRFAGIDDRWRVEFDWKARRVSIAHDKDEPLLLDMVEDSLDPLTLKLEMRQRLRQGDLPLHFQMVEEDEIDEQNFRLLPREWMETSLGCLLTVPVEKIRHNSKRFTRAWHAPDLDFIEVRIEHGKTGGNHMELRITELSFDGDEVAPNPGCAAMQSKAGKTQPPAGGEGQ
jgi:hypothetical protein